MIKIELLHLRRLSKEALWIVLGQAAAVVGTLIGVRILTGLLRPAQYGELALGLTSATLVHQTITAPLGAGFSRFYAAAAEARDLHNYLKAFRRLTIAATAAVITLAAVLTLWLLAIGWVQWLGLGLASLVYAFVTGYSGIFNGIQNAARQRTVVALHQGMDACLRFLLAAGMILWLGRSSSIAMTGYVIGSLLVLISQFLFFWTLITRHQASVIDHAETWSGRIWTYSWPFTVWGIFYWGQVASDRWSLATFDSPQDVGLYAVLFQLSYYPVSLSAGMAFQFLSPILFQRAGDATDARRKAHAEFLAQQITHFVLAITAVAFAAVFLLHDRIFAILVGSQYRRVSYLLPWALLTSGFFSAGQSIALRFMTRLQSHLLIPINVGIAVAGIAANFAGAFFAGINGVVSASLIVSTMYLLSLWLLAVKTK